MLRPCWVILTPRPNDLEALRRVVADSQPGATVAEQGGPYVAIVEMEPGSECCGEDALAATLSLDASGPCYLLWTDVDSPRVQVFERGCRLGELPASPDVVAAHLRCSFPGLSASARPGGALPTVVPDVARSAEREADDPVIDCATASEWARQMELDAPWSDALDPSPEVVEEVVFALAHPSPDVRWVAARLASCCLTEYSHPEGGREALAARLELMARTDRDARVRDEARRSASSLRSYR